MSVIISFLVGNLVGLAMLLPVLFEVGFLLMYPLTWGGVTCASVANVTRRPFMTSTLVDLASVCGSSVFVVEAMASMFGSIVTWQSPIAIVVSYDIWIRGLSVEYCVVIIVIERHNSSSSCID